MAANNIQTYVLSGVDTTLAGLNVGGWSVKVAYERPTCDDDYVTPQETFFQGFDKMIGSAGFFQKQLYKHDGNNPFYIYLRKDDADIFNVKPVINVLRTYKISRLGTFYPMLFNKEGGGIVNAFPPYGYFTAPYQGDLPTFCLYEGEKEDLLCFYDHTNKEQPDYIKNMLTILHESFSVENSNIKFIMWITILEMLIDGNTELIYRLSRSVAVLLGKTKDESVEIFDICKKLYNARSKYLHNGDDSKITTGHLMKALDYSRRMIANLMEINTGINNIRKSLDSNGYGSNPFNVRF